MARKTLTIVSVLAILTLITPAAAEQISNAFEFRYYSPDPAANGETDFRGKTTVLDTDQRVEFLAKYAEYARGYFNDPGLDTKVVSAAEIKDFLDSFKPQPQPAIRNRIIPENWKWLGCGPTQRKDELTALEYWKNIPGTDVKNGALLVTRSKATVKKAVEPMSWRFLVEVDTILPKKNTRSLVTLSDGDTPAITVGFDKGNLIYKTKEKTITAEKCQPNTVYKLKIEADLSAHRYNLYVNDRLVADFVEMQDDSIAQVDNISITAASGQQIDNLHIVNYPKTKEVRRPYTIETVLDEDFQTPPDITGWQNTDYDDSRWQTAALPMVHGGERYAGQDLYLRQTVDVKVKEFTFAQLNIETICPGGEIWINGQVAAVIASRHPIKLDITDYLQPNASNLIAVRVKPFVSDDPVFHAPADFNLGWFMGRMSLDLMTHQAYIDDVFVFTTDIEAPAKVRNRITITNKSRLDPFIGKLVINYYPWFPEESTTPAATAEFPIRVRAHSDLLFDESISIDAPALWTADSPNLYKVEVVLKGRGDRTLDDYVTTTGIRTVSQTGGTFRVNGKPDMLNGTQTMGFRMPLEVIAKHHRCAPAESLIEELLQTKKMNGNLLRVHNHALTNQPDGINDPRIAEMSDQLGMMLIWLTPSWIRTGQAWTLDFEGYPKFMKVVRNHPSIVMWEASNHPDKFKKYDLDESNLFYKKVYNTIYPTDQSRLISVTSHIGHTHFGNDAGTKDNKGNAIQAVPEFTAPMVTRGNQDSVTGYGSQWSSLREWPYPYQQDFLDSPDRAYFNFEHEESIGQPNWSLVRGKPWYLLQSYEWSYDTGSIGRKLTTDEWKESQAWQAMSAYESTRKQRLVDYDGFSWCCLHGGANMGTYKKPIIDCLGHAKLSWHTSKMVFQKTLAGSSNVDVVYGPDDTIEPVVMNLGGEKTVSVRIDVKTTAGETIDTAEYSDVKLPAGRTVTKLDAFKPDLKEKGYYAIEYTVTDNN